MYLNNREEKLKEDFVNKIPEAFSEIINLYSDKLYSIIYRIIDNHDDIKDILQNTFLKAFRYSHNFRKESSIYTYMVRIAINEAKLFVKKEKKHLFLEIDNDFMEKQLSVHEGVEKKILRKKVMNTINKLPYKYREIIVLRDIESLNTKEVARILNITPNAVKIRLYRARLLLKEILGESIERV